MRFHAPPIPTLDLKAEQAANDRQAQLTKPPGSLGRLETLGVHLSAITGSLRPSMKRKAIVVMAADHGVCAESVSAYPAAVTSQMLLNFAHGGAAINVLARQAGARLIVVDVGVAADLPALAGLLSCKVAYGTKNMACGPAMTGAQAEAALQAGLDIAYAEADAGLDVLATGDMGIGNTTAAAAITAAITGLPPAQVTGRGTGIDDTALAHKVAVVQRALDVNRPDPLDAMSVLSAVGGFEIAALAGLMLGAAARRLPVVIDGYISGAAALIAAGLSPAVVPYLIAGHRSVEVGHGAALQHLGLTPLLDLALRLGEGTGAALALHLVQAAACLQSEMATFAEAGVSGRG